MEDLKGGLLITPKEIQLITGTKYRAAYNMHQAIRDALGKPTNNLTVKEYCDYHKLDYNEVVRHLNKHR